MEILSWNELAIATKRAALQRPSDRVEKEVSRLVAGIFREVELNGDDALRSYSWQFDGVSTPNMIQTVPDVVEGVSDDDRAAIEVAARNIRTFHEQQGYVEVDIETQAGIHCRRVIRPLRRAGLYVPGGSAPLFSTLLMIAIPAQIAGVEELVVMTPPSKDGAINLHVLEAARQCGIKKIITVGGAQAIAAMALGTLSVPKVDKIFGPGNLYVAMAKSYAATLAGGPAYDLPAGPSEVMVIADAQANARYIAADLLAQAEHDPLAQVILLSTSADVARGVADEVETQLAGLSRRDIATTAMASARLIVVDDMATAIDVANDYAPEHLIMQVDDAETYVDAILTAGSVFLGAYTPEALGDYASGTNHVLPTAGAGRAYGGVNVESFQRTMTVQAATQDGLQALGPAVVRLANLEGLDAHVKSISVRLEDEQ